MSGRAFVVPKNASMHFISARKKLKKNIHNIKLCWQQGVGLAQWLVHQLVVLGDHSLSPGPDKERILQFFFIYSEISHWDLRNSINFLIMLSCGPESKPLRISRNGPFHLERLVVIDLSKLNNYGWINGLQNDKFNTLR